MKIKTVLCLLLILFLCFSVGCAQNFIESSWGMIYDKITEIFQNEKEFTHSMLNEAKNDVTILPQEAASSLNDVWDLLKNAFTFQFI